MKSVFENPNDGCVRSQENTENALAFTVKSLNINLAKKQIHKPAVGTIDCTEQNSTGKIQNPNIKKAKSKLGSGCRHDRRPHNKT